jgi:hypothetical protein
MSSLDLRKITGRIGAQVSDLDINDTSLRIVVRVITGRAQPEFGRRADSHRSQPPGHPSHGVGRALSRYLDLTRMSPCGYRATPPATAVVGTGRPTRYASLISAGAPRIIVVGSGAMAESDTIAV